MSNHSRPPKGSFDDYIENAAPHLTCSGKALTPTGRKNKGQKLEKDGLHPLI
ncbi:hypothetical protein [Aquabacterium sp.]|uniref:hypothetical protein n=1 Tax=Aquabacterium sp. TaxID=1872578 RepID=UPI0025C1B708|nr:hypothetical protein [Aquabacterium sp.]